MKLVQAAGLDRAVVFTLLSRGWSSLAGIVTLALIARHLTAFEQGFYYTFYSLVALQVIFELGFSTVILQTAGHEAAHLCFSADGTIHGPAREHNRLASVLQKAMKWYTSAAALMALILLPAGIVFFRFHAASQSSVAWLMPWTFIVLASSCTFQIDPTFSFLEGCGFVPAVARVRLVQGILGSALGWLALVTRHGLFAPAAIVTGQAIAGVVYLVTRRKLLVPLLRRRPGTDEVHWGAEVWPFQWRIAISWLCGYFTFQFFTPIVFASRGAVEAGQLGMSLNICSTLSTVCIAWINTKASPFGQLIALRRFAELDRLFRRSLAQSLVIAFAAATSVLVTLVMLRSHHIALAARLLPPPVFALLLAAMLLNVVVFGEAIYMRAHKQEKFMLLSLAGALYMAPAAIYCGRHYGALGISIIYLSGTVVIGVGLGTYTFSKWRRIWHA